MTPTRLVVTAVEGLPEVAAGDDLAALVAAAVRLGDGDVLVVTSKVVSKAEGRVLQERTREDALAGETDRVVARRGPTTVVRTRHGLVMAAAGIDASNTPAGTVVLLPLDPDASARTLREALLERTGANVGVLVSDTSGRAWRVGQTDIAVGAAGLAVVDDHAGRVDPHGHELAVTAPALADEIAGAADLVKGKLGRRPVAVVRGLEHLVLPAGSHGPGAATLVRPEEGDLFGLGAREAVLRAVTPSEDSARGFGAPGAGAELVAALREALEPRAPGQVHVSLGDVGVEVATDPALSAETRGALRALTEIVGRALGHEIRDAPQEPHRVVLRPARP